MMVEISTKSLFGKKPLIEEQFEIYFASENIDAASLLLDPRVAGSQIYEPLYRLLPEKRRHEKAREHYQRALEHLNKIM